MPTLVSAKPLNAGVTEEDLPTFTQFASGMERTAYWSFLFPGVVIKRAEDAWQEAQVLEVLLWGKLCEDGFSDYVPKHDVLYTQTKELVLSVEHIKFTEASCDLNESHCAELRLIRDYTKDLWPGVNTGFTTDNRFILRDAGSPAPRLRNIFLQPA